MASTLTLSELRRTGREGLRAEPQLILSRTPLRVSFAGGGTDLPAFYSERYGAVLSTAIDRYVYVTVKRHGALFNEPIRLNYSETELVEKLDDIRNAIARECLRLLDVGPPIYISTVADIPASSGLGSSSSFAVGLLNALHAFKGERVSAGQLAEEAAHVELDLLGRPMGKQDHYPAAFGGLNLLTFLPDGGVSIEPKRMANGTLDKMFGHVMMFWSGLTRDSSSILSEQRRNTERKADDLLRIRGHAIVLNEMLADGFDAAEFGRVLDETWQLKRGLASRITTGEIDGWYASAREAGALGGKLCGAGGGGFLLLIVPPDAQPNVRRALAGVREISIGYESQGSRILFPSVA